MFAIAYAENDTCDPKRHNETSSETHRDKYGNVICVGSYGVLQVGCLHYPNYQGTDDLAQNVKLAHNAWTSREKWGVGYEAWTQYNEGVYLAFLNR